MVTKAKCLICEARPAVIGVYCRQCRTSIQAQIKKQHQAPKVARPSRYVTYQDKVIAMIDLGHGLGKYAPLETAPAKLPKAKTIDLNLFCPNLSREEVKRLKRLVLSLTGNIPLIGVTYEKSKA